MNRILRPTLSVRAIRASILVMSTLFCHFLIGQASIQNCPNPITNIVISSPSSSSCSEFFSLATYPTSMDGNVEWFSTGSTGNGSAMSTLPISAFSSIPFNFGLSTVTFQVVSMAMDTAQCSTIVFVSEEANLPTTTCDPIVVDLNDGCSGDLNVPYNSVIINTDICDPMAIDSVELSWGMVAMDPPVRTLVVDAHNGNPSFYSLYLRKYREEVLVRQANCLVQVSFINEQQPVLTCPSDETRFVAPDCYTTYLYDVEGVSSPPCGGEINMTMPGGGPSGTQLGEGSYTYAYELLDSTGAQVTMPAEAAPCSWTVAVIASADASTTLSCQASLNVSIDQNCMATIDVPTILTGSTCTPAAMFTLFAVIDGVEQTGPTLTFTEDHVGQTFDVSVIGPNGNNSCWGKVTIEDKIGPAIICPPDTIISCTSSIDTSVLGMPMLVGADCEDVTIYYSDASVTTMCTGPYQSVISRRFYAVDGAGNQGAACTQTISIERETLLSATLPPHWDGLDMHSGIQDNGVGSNDPLSCDGAGVVYDTIVRSDGRVVPSPYANGDLIGTGFPGGVGTCGTIFSFYEDLIIEICEQNCSQNSPSYKVLRTWDVFDWCTGNTLIHQQIIKVLDTIAPEFTVGVPDMTVSTDLWGCGATINLPSVSASDNCSSEVSYSWSVSGGTYDPATNRVYVADRALTKYGEEILLIAYAEDCCGNIAADTGRVTIVDLVPPIVVADEHTVVALNNQSNDGHTKVYASTFDDGSWDGCGPIDWWVRRMDNACEDFDGDPDTEIDEVADFHKWIHFCCNDVPENQMVVFMVCDDGDGDGVPEMNGDDNCSTAMIEVDVQDKLAPTINCPTPKSINCIDFVAFENLLDTDLSEDDVTKLDTRFGTAFSNSTCGELGAQTFTTNMDEFCGEGAVTRTFVVTTDNGQATCSQNISIVLEEENVMTCDRISFPIGSAERNANYDWCDPFDTESPFVSTIKVLECGGTTITEPVIDRDNLCTEVGINLTLDTFDFAGGACIKILAHWEIIDQCLFEENFLDEGDDEINPFLNENGYYELYIEYDIFDTDAPELTCDDITVETEDCEIFNGTLTMSATDACTDDALISITYKVDIDADGDYDYPAGGGAAEGNTFDASSIGGLPIGTHSIKWLAYDGCGNYAVCHQDIEVVKQEKAPTPYCHLGLASAVMDSIYGCSVEMWAIDFVAGGFDDCDANLTYLMIPYQDIYGKPADLDDDLSVEEALEMAQPNWEFGCEYIENGIAHVIEIRIYAVDEDGQSDFCDASLTLNDNFDCCNDLEFGISTMISGNVASEEGSILESVAVSIMSNDPEFPRIQATSDQGSFIFNSLAYEKNYELTATNNDNTKEGVTTLDLLLIQRHILGIAELSSPYKVIAADINGNGKISALDLLQLRKLILGLYPNDLLPDNTSWRYVDHEFTFADVKNPFPFGETKYVSKLAHAMYNQNFIGVKTGDVNGSISAQIAGDAHVRSGKQLSLGFTDQVFKAGDEVVLEVKAEDFSTIYGMQMGINFDMAMMDFSTIQAGVLSIDESNYAVSDEGIRISWNEYDLTAIQKDEILLTLRFTAKEDAQLSDLISLDEEVLTSEAYNSELQSVDVVLTARSIPASGLVLMQNEPNPFAEFTTIGFIVPEAGSVNLTVYDVTGKVVLSNTSDCSLGINKMVIRKSDIGTSGVMYYQLIYGNESATRKMILLD